MPAERPLPRVVAQDDLDRACASDALEIVASSASTMLSPRSEWVLPTFRSSP